LRKFLAFHDERANLSKMRKRPHKLPSPESHFLSEQYQPPFNDKLNRTTYEIPSRKTSMAGGGIIKKNRRIVIDA
jgi:hypothetical protein